MRRESEQPLIFDLFAEEEQLSNKHIPGWPPIERFPLNIDGRHVENIVLNDLKKSRSPLLVTGFTSLDRLLDFCSEAYLLNPLIQVRLLIGQEPFPSRRETYTVNRNDFTAEVEAYWLDRGISLIYSAKVIKMVELLKDGKIQARFMPGNRRLHAKIYCGDEAVTVGSSNFTDPGFRSQIEANARFEKDGRSNRFEELTLIAENYWQLGRSYQEQLIALLEKLLRVVTWQEALARACAELLEREWAEKYIRGDFLSRAGELWPSQKQGIAQALAVLSNQGSVLIADATGAGKTRMGVYLIGAVQDQILRSGRIRRGKALMICPPSVEENWLRETGRAGVLLETHSHGKLSNKTAKRRDLVIDSLRQAQILCVDEGHNFLNLKSQRTQHLLRNMADNVILLTATPINKSVIDLLRIADMLGADNLSDSILKAFQKMLGSRQLNRALTEAELNELRKEIRRFTVRRTKKQLNALVDREPELYQDESGKTCRFPKHLPKVYKLNEPDVDRQLALTIQKLADKFYGVTHFVNPVFMPEILKKHNVSEEEYLKGRLTGAKKLARYMVMSSLRSSRAAVIEHINGTEIAIELFRLTDFHKQTKTGNITNQIKKINGHCPENQLSIDLPAWLSDPQEHTRACANDLMIYRKIADLVLQMSDSREKTKADRLIKLKEKHNLLLAFDSKPISLASIKKYIGDKVKTETLMAWGGSGTGKEQVLKSFAQDSTSKDIIGLCSDSMSEGVNLQQASCLVHLDMPSVVRIAEQRAGRVDRMDTPHESIEIWWPEDAEEFALKSDERFIERYETVEDLLGSNMPLPDSMRQEKPKTISTQEMIAAVENQEIHWDGIDDAFSPIRSLVEGKSSLIDEAIYERYRTIKQRVLSRVSLVKSKSPWALFCITAGTFGAPIWVLLPSYNGKPITDLGEICREIRKRLNSDVENIGMDQNSSRVLENFLTRLSSCERELLAKKKQRALEEIEHVIKKLKLSVKNQKQIDHLLSVERMLINPPPDKQPDWDEVASRWLDVIRPVWFEKLNDKRNKPLRLQDVRKDLLERPDWLVKEIELHFKEFPLLPKPDERIKACIIGLNT